MNRYFMQMLFISIVCHRVWSVTPMRTEIPQNDEDDDWDEDEESSEADDDGRVYKNPRNSPSSECPRDEEQATLLGQKCLRKCSSDEDCKSKKKKCLCDGVCGMSCIKPDRECPELAQPSLGQVSFAGRHFGARASYSCPHGYNVVGLQSRLCQADGNWAGAEPACKQNIYCLQPPQIEHARNSALMEQETFDLDSTVQYHCHTGYVTNGFPRAKCLAIDGQASWYGPDIQCEPRSCGQPPDPANGWHSGECYTYGCKISYNCGNGYELVGKNERTCQSDGSWTPKELPTCVLVTSVICPTPDNPKNGKATYTTLAYNSVVSYECRYGYTLVGESSSRCGADRKWSGTLPVCKEINCGHPGILYNGWIENIEVGTGLGASIIFRCQPEMLIIGHSSSVCQIDGRWRNSLPECLAPCVVPTISQGYVIPIEISADDNGTTVITSTTTTQLSITQQTGNVEKVKHGTALEVKCDKNYEFPVSLLSPPTCHNGTWSIIPRCVPARCKNMPRPPKHGMVLAPKTEHGMKARFKCKDGFKLVSPGGKDIIDSNEYVLTCAFGIWIGETPQCQEVFCSFPGYIPNGKVLLVGNMGLYDYRPYVKKIVNNKQIMYDCDKGYVLDIGPPGATCVGGKWRPLELPQCLLGQHPRLRWNRKRRAVEMRHKSSSYHMRENRMLQKLQNEIDFHYPERKLTKSQTSFAPKRENDSKDIEDAYSKYYEKIKDRYQNFVKTLLGYNQYRSLMFTKPYKFPAVENSTPLLQTYQNDNNLRIFKSLSHNIPKQQQHHMSTEDILNNSGELKHIFRSNFAKIPIPNIYENSRYNTIRTSNENNSLKYALNNVTYPSKNVNIADYIEHLKAQVIRKRSKRASLLEENSDSITTEVSEYKEGRKKTRLWCEELDWDSFVNITTIRPGKAPGRNSIGVILSLECNAGFKLNINDPNVGIRCIRGSWKPETPKCISAPCLVPSIDNGKYYKAESQAKKLSDKASLTPLSTYEEVQSNEFITLQCEDGYKIQGSAQLRCAHGSWSGGYRAGLTIGHNSNVNARCNYSTNSLPIQLSCSNGVLSPQNIHCESGMRISREEVLQDAKKESPMKIGSASISQIIDSSEHDNISNSSDYDDSKMCGAPSISEGILTYNNDISESEYESGTEIFFNCIPSASGDRNTWKIICENGQWVGRSYNCVNGTCLFKNNEPNVVSFYNDLEIREDIVEFPPGATITSRCTDVGKFELVGSVERVCIYSEWTGVKPACYGLNQENDYAMEKAPTILFRHQNGPIAQSNDGKLIVYPGTTLHMECLWMRRFGNPKWSVNHSLRNYSEGWVNEEGRDATLEYRLTITNADDKDSGVFSCQTPARHEHSVEILVKEINCPEIPIRRGLIINTNSTKLSTRVLLSCSNGNSLIGASELFCLPSGNWSAPLPVCESVECGDIPVSNNVTSPQIAILSREVGGRASFSCSSGYGLKGPSEAICLPSGEWAIPFPTCVEVQCENPGAPENGYAQGSMPYRAGDVVQFNCNPEYMMQGQPIIACQDNGRWSGILPKCVQACPYPGTAISGHMSSVQFYYAIGESITFTCDAGLELRGPKMVKCLKNGKWSGAIPQCVPLD